MNKKYKSYTPEFKLKVALEALKNEKQRIKSLQIMK